MANQEIDTGWRGSSDLWLKAAYDTLLASGIDSVRILPLAKQLKLSRTSFYWFFEDRDALLQSLLSLWRDKNTGNFVKQANTYAETIAEAVLNVFDCWFDSTLFDAKLEFAVRSWALQSETVQADVKKADLSRQAALKNLFTRYGHDDMSADVRARTMYLVQIGHISMQTSETLRVRMSRIAKYVEVYTDRAPRKRELERFFARHDHKP